MNVQFLIFILGVVCLMQGCASIDIRTDKTLFKLLLETRDISRSHPERSNTCFGYYVPQMNAASDKFESDYANCVTNATNNRSSVDNAAKAQQVELKNAIAGTCEDGCQQLNGSAINIFNCYETQGGSAAKSMYQVSANAVEYRQNVETQYTVIDGEQNRCTNATEREYIEKSTAIYESLNFCLSGHEQPASVQTSTEYYTQEIPEYTTTWGPETMNLKNKHIENNPQNILKPLKIQ